MESSGVGCAMVPGDTSVRGPMHSHVDSHDLTVEQRWQCCDARSSFMPGIVCSTMDSGSETAGMAMAP